MQTLLMWYSWLAKAVEGKKDALAFLGRVVGVVFDMADLQGRQQYGASVGVSSVSRSAWSLVIGLVRRHISARFYRVYRRIGIRLIGLYSYAYWYEAYYNNALDRDLEC